MPIYACYRGDYSNRDLEQPGCFVLHDALGRNYLCVEMELDLELMEPSSDLPAAPVSAQALARKCGFDLQEGSEVVGFLVAPDADSLKQALVLSTHSWAPKSKSYTPAFLGWLDSQEEFGPGRPVRVLVRNGQQSIEAQGESHSEAWSRIGQKALEEKPSMTLTIQADPVPLRTDEGGTLRVGNSRVPLDTVVHEYEQGADPESIVHAYPTLKLVDVYAVIAYYLRHREDVQAYLDRRKAEAKALRQEIESQQPSRAGLREKLLARRERQEQDHAAAGS